MPNTYDILVNLRSSDSGFVAAFTAAERSVEQLSKKLVFASKLGNPDFNADRYKKIGDANRARAGELRELAKGYADLAKKQGALSEDQAKELAAIQQLIDKRQKLASTYGRIASLREQDAKFAETQYQLAKKIVTLESQAAQSASGEISRRRTIAEIAKQKQDAEVKGAVLADKGARAAAQELSIRQQLASLATQEALAKNASVTKQRIATALAKDEQDVQVKAAVSAQQSARAAREAAAAQGNLAQRLGRTVAALLTAGALLRASVGALKMFTGASLAAGKAVGTGLVKSLQVLIGIARSVISTMGKVAGAIGKTVGMVGRAAGSFVSAIRAKQRYREVTGQVADAEGWHSRSLKGLVGNVVNVNRWINTLGSSVRQLGQAFQNAGTTFSIFVSLPLTMFGKGLFDTAVAFNSQLIEVRKNADIKLKPEFDGDFALEQLDLMIRDIAARSPTPIVDLGAIAVDAAKLGLDPEAIAPFVEIMDKFVVSTDVTAGEATDSIGRIMSIFYDMSSSGITQDVGAFSKTVLGLASAINEVGQANPVGEKDVIATLLRMAPGARALNMSLADSIGLSASVASASASAERAGTQLGTALNMTAQNLDKIAAAGGMEVETLQQFADSDITSAFVGIAEAISKIESPTLRAAAAQELMGAIGGKAINILGADIPSVVENIALSNAAFDDATSILREFDRAMDSVANQMGLLKNQFDLIGLSLGDALLPAITDVLTYVVPLMQAVAQAFRGLDQTTKMWIVGIMLLLAVLGPLLVALGSIMFSLGILTTGLTGLFTVFGKIIALPLMLAGALLGLLSPFKLIIMAVVAAAMAMAGFGGMLGDLGSMVVEFAQGMYTWGYNAFMGFGDGIEAAASYVVDMVVAVLTTIREMLEAFSPPKKGPLRDIDVWGRNIAQTFVDGFARADMAPVYEFAGMIAQATEGLVRGLGSESLTMYGQLSSIITSAISDIGGFMGLDPEVLDANKIGGLEAFVGVLDAMQGGTTSLSDAFEQLSQYTGAFSADIQKLIGLQDDYNDGQERLEEIQDRLDNFDRETEAQVKGIASRKDISARERIALIRQARITASIRKTQLEDEKRMAELQQENLQKQIDLQKQLIQILSDLMPSASSGGAGGGDEAAAIDDIADSAEEANEDIGDLKSGIEGMQEKLATATSDMKEKFADMGGEVGKFVTSMSTAREQLKGFLDAILGRDKPAGTNSPDYLLGWDKGWETRERYLKWLAGVKTGWDNVRGAGDKLAAAMGSLAAGFQLVFGNPANTEDLLEFQKLLGPLALQLFAFGIVLGNAAKQLGEYGAAASAVFRELIGAGEEESVLDIIIKKLGEFRDAFVKAFGDGNPAIDKPGLLLAPFGGIAVLLSVIAGLAFDNIDELGGFFGTIANYLTRLWGVAGALAVIAASFAGMESGNLAELLKQNLELIGNGKLTEVIQEALALGDPNDSIGMQIVDYISGQIQAADWTQIATDLANGINQALFGGQQLTLTPGSPSGVTTSSPTEGLVDKIDVTVIAQLLSGVVEAILSFVATLKLGDFGVKVAEEFNKITTELKDIDFAGAAKNIGTALSDALGAIKFEDVGAVIVNFLNGIVAGLKAGIEDESLDEALNSFVTALINGLANIDWTAIVETTKTLLIKLLTAISEAPWGTLGAELTNILTSLLNALADKTLWSTLGTALGAIGGAIAKGIYDAPWGTLFNADTMRGMAKAFLDGFTEAVMGAFGAGESVAAEQADVVVTSLQPDATGVPISQYGVDDSLQNGLSGVANGLNSTSEQINSFTQALNPVNAGVTLADWMGNDFAGWITDFSPQQLQDVEGPLQDVAPPQYQQPTTDMAGLPLENQVDLGGMLSQFVDTLNGIQGTPSAPQEEPQANNGGWFDGVSSAWNDFFSGTGPAAGAVSSWLSSTSTPASASGIENGVLGLQQFSIYGSQIAQAAQQVQPMYTAQTYAQWVASQSSVSDMINQQSSSFLSFLPVASNAATLTESTTTSLAGVGTGLQNIQEISGSYNEQMDAVMPVLQALSSGISAGGSSDATSAVGALLGAMIFTGLSTYIMENGATTYNYFITSFALWSLQNLATIQLAGATLATIFYSGLATYVNENISFWDVVSKALFLWIITTSDMLINGGTRIGSLIRSGYQELLDKADNYSVIGSSFEKYVDSIDSSSSMMRKARQLGEDIAEAIGEGIENAADEIADSIEAAINSAIASVDVTVDAPPPAGGGGASTGSGDGGGGGVPATPGSKSGFRPLVEAANSLADANRYPQSQGNSVTFNFNGPIYATNKKEIEELSETLYRQFSARMAKESRTNRRY